MKKIIALIIALAACMIFGSTAFADGASPDFISYDVVVNNKKGAVTYHFENVLKAEGFGKSGFYLYGKELNVYGEMNYQGTDYLLISGDWCYVRKDDVRLKNESMDEIEYDDGEKNIEHTFHILKKDGVQLYVGPSDLMYDKVEGAVIPYGYDFVNKDYYEPYYENRWFYVEYNGYKGWASFAQTADNFEAAFSIVDYPEMAGKLKTVADGITLMDESFAAAVDSVDYGTRADLKNVKRVSDPIPAGTELNFKYFVTVREREFALTEYNGKEGWIEFGEGTRVIEYVNEGMITVSADNKSVYDKCEGGKAVDFISIYDPVTITAVYEPEVYTGDDDYLIWAQVKQGDTEGWVNIEPARSWEYLVYDNHYTAWHKTFKKTTAVYSFPGSQMKIDDFDTGDEAVGIFCLRNSESYSLAYSYSDDLMWVYYISDGVRGWILENSDELFGLMDEQMNNDLTDKSYVEIMAMFPESAPVENEETEVTEVSAQLKPVTASVTVTEPAAKTAEKEDGNKTVIITCAVAGAAVLAAAAGFVIRAKKKKSTGAADETEDVAARDEEIK